MSSLYWREREKGRKRKRGKWQGQIGRRKGDGGTQDGIACEKDSFQSVSPDRGMASWTRNEKDESRRRRRRRRRYVEEDDNGEEKAERKGRE